MEKAILLHPSGRDAVKDMGDSTGHNILEVKRKTKNLTPKREVLVRPQELESWPADETYSLCENAVWTFQYIPLMWITPGGRADLLNIF